LAQVSLIVKRAVIALMVLLALVYAVDSIRVRSKMARPNSGDAFGSVQMERLYAVPQKNGNIEYEFDALQPEVTVPCVHSLFPHMGNTPCWYLQRNRRKPIPM
jgi:hypothetical protein